MRKILLLEKIRILMLFPAIIAAFSFSQSVFARKEAANFYAHLKAEHAAAVKNHIGDKANLRPAQISDCKNKSGLASFRQSSGKTAHPFYAVADFNRDKIADFAVVLYDSKKAADSRFTMLIFDGAQNGGYRLAHKTENLDLRQGGIWTDGFGASEGRPTVTAGVFETDDAIWIVWENGRYAAHEGAESEN